jgi:hypothetical protein
VAPAPARGLLRIKWEGPHFLGEELGVWGWNPQLRLQAQEEQAQLSSGYSSDWEAPWGLEEPGC